MDYKISQFWKNERFSVFKEIETWVKFAYLSKVLFENINSWIIFRLVEQNLQKSKNGKKWPKMGILKFLRIGQIFSTQKPLWYYQNF